MKSNVVLFCLALLYLGCQDVIDVDLEDGTPQLVVDAWVNNKTEPQIIKLRMTVPYFEAMAAPAVTNATVTLTNGNEEFPFLEVGNTGDYVWEPTEGKPIGEVGDDFSLAILHDGKEFAATSSLKRVTPIDSITWEYREKELGNPEGIYAQFYARDFDGEGDAYWIKAYKNGEFLNKPQELNIAYDASFSADSGDGIVFISPIREGINRVPDGGDDAVDDDEDPPYVMGDSIYVEIHSITEEAFYFLSEARTQMTLGDATIFAPPPANVTSNIVQLNAAEGDAEPLGFFSVSGVSSMGITIAE